jgi:long-chain acyl-CoA synthetase
MRNLLDLGRANGSNVALQHGAQQMAYAELLRSAEAFGARLRSQGLARNDFAVLLLENSIDYVVALLGVWVAGAVAVPLNPETTATSLRGILDDCAAKILVSRSRILDRLGKIALPSTIVLYENRDLSSPAAPTQSIEDEPADPALLLYTSGTTGRPKGVVLMHANLLANTSSIVEYLGLTSADSIVNVLPFFHSFGNSVLLTHLAAGGKVIVENRFAFPNQVVQTMQALRPSGFSGVPTTFYILIHKSTFLQQDWSFLRYVSQAGGGMRVETVRQLRQCMPNTGIYIMYGQTEASARLTYLPPDMLEKKIGSIGIAIPGVELRVVDESGQIVSGDQVGEIVARGPNIMAGYLNDPQGTAEVLRNGWLHTGDMARVDDDGFLYIVSRKADFIKSASHRISPAEIEEAIAASAPDVEDVAVIGVPDELLGEAVAACVCCPVEKFDAASIRDACMGKLPLHKVPKYVVHETAIPRTASGKKKYVELREKYRDLGGPLR